ncbi:FtsX-like permease family protein [Brevundimonas sp. 3P9-tot-E]|uniref:ABC transporter permease n=1 Tax=unclassified Brevundimonas TaxID=2622653 RepID=UPI0039A2E9C2
MRSPSPLRLLTLAALAVAFTAFSLVAAAVQHERRYNASFDPANEVYQIYTRVGRSGQDAVAMASGLSDLAPALTASEQRLAVARVARDNDPRPIEIDGKTYWVAITEADPSIVDVFNLGEDASAFQRALARPDGLIITRSLARELFGADHPSQTVMIGSQGYSVVAVIDDLDRNSSFSSDRAFISSRGAASSLRLSDAVTAGLTFSIGGATTFVRASDPDQISRIAAIANRHATAAIGRFVAANPGAGGVGLQVSHHLVPLRDLEQAVALGANPDGSRLDQGSLFLLVAVALVIVLVASLNAASLNLSQTLVGAPAIAVRRAFGAGRSHIARGVIGQAVISGLAAGLIGLAAAFLLSDAFGTLINRPLPRWPDLTTLAAVLAAGCGSGLIAGGYAAWITTRMRPREVLGARDVSLPGMKWIRSSLVATQIAGSAATLIFAVAVSLQLAHLASATLGFTPDGLSAYRLPETLAAEDPRRNSLLAQSRAVLGASHVAFAGVLPTEGAVSQRIVIMDGRSVEIATASWLPNSLEMLGASLIAGAPPKNLEDAQAGRDARNQSAAISETTARRLGFQAPSDAIGALLSTDRPGVTWSVSAVVADLPMGRIRGGNAAVTFVHDGGPAGFLIAPAEAVQVLDPIISTAFPSAPVDRISLRDQVNIAFADLIRLRGLILAFAAVLTATAAVGVLAMTLDRARQMRKEAAVRRAFGAQTSDIGRLLARRILMPVGAGFILGTAAGVIGTQWWLSAYPDKVSFAPPSILAATAVLSLASVLAAVTEIWRLSVARPVNALRED